MFSLRFLGIDPGTRSFDVCCFEDDVDNVVLDISIPSEDVAKDPYGIFEVIKLADADFIVGPSGYGLEFKHISKLTDRDIALTTLDKIDDVDIPVLKGLRRLLRLMKEANLNAYSIPGVIQLPTIPIHRKLNKIDMGTADKTCVAALAVWDQAREYGISYSDVDLICVEIGFGYNAAIAVENGKIIDGIGGTIFPGPGYLTLSLMDGELAYLLGSFSKLKLFQGGAVWFASGNIIDPIDFSMRIDLDERFRLAWNAMLEGILKAISMELTVLSRRPREIIITGRLSRVNRLFEDIEAAISKKFNLNTRRPKAFAKVAKDVAQGAALIANGIGNGKYRDLTDCLDIKNARGTVLDYITIPDFNVDYIVKNLRSN